MARRVIAMMLTSVIVVLGLNSRGYCFAFIPFDIKTEIGVLVPSKDILVGNGAIGTQQHAGISA
jgi:hypothetical protein